MQQYTYCPKCGGELEYKLPEAHAPSEQPVCTKCGFVFWQNSKPTVSALMVDAQGRTLLVERGIDPRKGEWDLPGGFLEDGEDPKEGLKREMREELSVDTEPGALLGLFPDTYAYGGEVFNTLNAVYMASIVSGELRPGDDVSGVRWFKPDELPERMAFRNNEIALNAFLMYLGSPKRYGAQA